MTRKKSYPVEGICYYGPLLFTPGDRPDRFAKGFAASGGALVLDLEDGVAADHKELARQAVAEWLRGAAAILRINRPGTSEFAADRAALAGTRPAGIMIPKAESESDLEAVREAWPGTSLLPLVESPAGLLGATQLACSTGVVQLCLGMIDLAAACRSSSSHPGFVQHARIQLVIASAAASIAGPIDSPFASLRDAEALRVDTAAAAALGFFGKLCIHPAQLDPVRHALMPDDEELQWAAEVIAAGEGRGAVGMRGAMVDAPVVARARQLLERARRLRGESGT